MDYAHHSMHSMMFASTRDPCKNEGEDNYQAASAAFALACTGYSGAAVK